MIGDERTLIDTTRKRQRKWIGHRLRGVLLPRTAIQWKMDGKKTRNNYYCLCYYYNKFYFTSFYASVSSSLYHFINKKIKRPVTGAPNGGGPLPWHNG